jgi:hypothetical protein
MRFAGMVDVQHPERLLAAEERHADRRPDLLQHDRLAGKTRIRAGVIGEDGDAIPQRRPRDRLGYGAGAVGAAPVACDL